MWIMESILIFLVVSLMSSEVLGISQSMSCSMVNGQTICEKQTSAGNSAAAFGGAAVGGGRTYQDAYAGAENPGQWDYGRQTVYGTIPGANNGAPPPSGNFPGPNNGAPPTGFSSGVYTSSSSSDSFPGQAGGFGFATGGGYPVGGGGFAFGGGYPAQGSSYPAQGGGYPTQGGGYPAQAGGYPAQGGAVAGGFGTGGFFPFGGGYPAQAPAQNPDAPSINQGQQGFDPFMFVRPFLGGGGGGGFAGGFAGIPFGRR